MNAAMAPLWQIEDELQTLLDSLDTCPPELLEELETRIAKYVSAEIEKVDKVGAVLASLESVQANAKAEIERLRARQQAAEKAGAQLEAYVLRVIRQRDGKPLRGRNTTFSMRRTEALTIVAPELVPDRFKRTTVTIDIPKTAIKQALKDGEEVPGVVLQQNEHLVRK